MPTPPRLLRTTYFTTIDASTGQMSGHHFIGLRTVSDYRWTLEPNYHPFIFNPLTFWDSSEYTVVHGLYPTEDGVYTYEFHITNNNDGNPNPVTLQFFIELTVINSQPPEPEPEPELPCALKYYIEWTGNDRSHDEYRVDICYKGYTGAPIPLMGYCDLEYAGVKDVLDCIRGASANLTIHADKHMSLEDLYFEEEKTAKLTLYRNEEVIFIGHIKPDGVWQSFVEENYDIQLDATDGLGTLKNLAFVDAEKKNFVGRITQMEAVKAILHRTGLDLPINVCIKKMNNSQPINTNPMDYTKISTEQYYKEDGSTIMDCEQVLKSILEPYNAIICQSGAEWYIFSPLDLTEYTSFIRYAGEEESRVNFRVKRPIGSQINGYTHHHMNKNQQIRMDGSVGAFRVHYKYGQVRSILANANLIPGENGTEGWILLNGATSIAEGGVYSQGYDKYILELDQDIILAAGNALNVKMDFELSGMYDKLVMYLKAGDYYLNGQVWTLSNSGTQFEHYNSIDGGFGGATIRVGAGRTTIEYQTDPIPQNGNLALEIYVPRPAGYSGSPQGFIKIYSINITAGQNAAHVGEFHTITRVGESTIVKSNKTVHNGDGRTDAYLGTLYDLNDDPTQYWSRYNGTAQYELLALMVLDTAILGNRPCQIFSGDVRGFLPYLMFYTINNVSGDFLPLSYYFRTKDNVIELEGKQFFTELISSYDYKKTFDYGNSSTPTIQ